MRISKTTRSILIESGVGVGAALAIAAACRVPDLGVGVLAPHPVWLVVLVLAARYGVRGLIVVMVLAWGALAAAAAPWAGGAGVARTLDVLATPSELGALAAAMLVAWIASAHERRHLAQAEKLAELEKKSEADTAAIDELRNAALALRSRSDRLDMSLTFLRDIAHRLDGNDANAAAEAALELVITRLGARAAAVEMLAPGGNGATALTTMSASGIWNGEGVDRTALAALATGRATRALDLRESGPDDSDVAAPLMDVSGATRGVLVARGLPGGGVGATAVRDLSVIAEWLAPALIASPDDRDAADSDGSDADGATDVSGRPVVEINA